MVRRLLTRPFPLLLSALAALPARAADFRACAGEAKGKATPALKDIVTCQKAAKRDFIESYAKEKKAPPPAELLDRLEDFQKAEVREFLARHPEMATMASAQDVGLEPGPVGEEVQTAAPGPLGLLRAILARGKEAFEALFPAAGGVTEPAVAGKPRPEPEAFLPEAEDAALDVIGEMKGRDVDLEKAKDEARRDPVGAVQRAVKNYNRELDQDLDPGIRKLFVKPGKTAAGDSGRSDD